MNNKWYNNFEDYGGKVICTSHNICSNERCEHRKEHTYGNHGAIIVGVERCAAYMSRNGLCNKYCVPVEKLNAPVA